MINLSAIRTRRRKLPGLNIKALTNFNPFATFVTWDTSGSQVTVSEGHPFKNRSREAPIQDVGGDFYTNKRFMWNGSTLNHVELSAVADRYSGPLIPTGSFNVSASPYFCTPIYPPTFELTNADMDKQGNIAIARCKPGQPYTRVGQDIADTMKDGLASIPLLGLLRSKAGSLPGRASDEWLNFSFGVRPLVDSAMDVVHAIKHSEKILDQLRRDSGRVVRRGYTFPREQSSTNTDPVGFNTYPSYGPGTMPPNIRTKYNFVPGTVQLNRTIVRDSWFSGAFTYYLPDNFGKGSTGLSDKIDALLGTNLDAELIWEIAPWSWAADWFSNAGSTVSNLQSFGDRSLVMHYGYLMVTTTVTDTYRWSPLSDSHGMPGVSEVTLCSITKQRRRANPFGFGLSWNGLSPFQLSIAAAVGITHH